MTTITQSGDPPTSSVGSIRCKLALDDVLNFILMATLQKISACQCVCVQAHYRNSWFLTRLPSLKRRLLMKRASRSNCRRPPRKRAGVTLPLYFFAFSEVSSVVSQLFGVVFKTWNSCNAGDSTTVTPFWVFHSPLASISPLSPSPVESLYH
jgi:hypothetical protein